MKFRFGWWFLRFMAVMGFIWDLIMIPAWISQGQWGATLVQLLVLAALPSIAVCFVYGLYWIAKRFIVREGVQYPVEQR